MGWLWVINEWIWGSWFMRVMRFSPHLIWYALIKCSFISLLEVSILLNWLRTIFEKAVRFLLWILLISNWLLLVDHEGTLHGWLLMRISVIQRFLKDWGWGSMHLIEITLRFGAVIIHFFPLVMRTTVRPRHGLHLVGLVIVGGVGSHLCLEVLYLLLLLLLLHLVEGVFFVVDHILIIRGSLYITIDL